MVNSTYNIMPTIGMADIEKIIELYRDSHEDEPQEHCSDDTEALVDELYSVIGSDEIHVSVSNGDSQHIESESPHSDDNDDEPSLMEALKFQLEEQRKLQEEKFAKELEAQKQLMQQQIELERQKYAEQARLDAEKRAAEAEALRVKEAQLQKEKELAEREAKLRMAEIARREEEAKRAVEEAETKRIAEEAARKAADEAKAREEAEKKAVAEMRAREARARDKEIREAKQKELETLMKIKAAREAKAKASAKKPVTTKKDTVQQNVAHEAVNEPDRPVSFYNDLDTPALFNAVKKYALSIGMANKVIGRDILNSKFGKHNIDKLITKSYLISLGKGVTFGNG